MLYIYCLIIITILAIAYYYVLDSEHKKELAKINKLEILNMKEQQELDIIRSETIPCQSGNFTDPKTCYYNSDYNCSWNEKGRRCDQK
jgi:hypothetical protein